MLRRCSRLSFCCVCFSIYHNPNCLLLELTTFHLRVVVFLVVDTLIFSLCPFLCNFCNRPFLPAILVVCSALSTTVIFVFVSLVVRSSFMFVTTGHFRLFFSVVFLVRVLCLSRHLNCWNQLGGRTCTRVLYRVLFRLSCYFSLSSCSIDSLQWIFRLRIRISTLSIRQE